ncbi:MAG: serpin family protein [Clostridia bacterium]|nr:serpin family protein [Clostridia bacterium]
MKLYRLTGILLCLTILFGTIASLAACDLNENVIFEDTAENEGNTATETDSGQKNETETETQSITKQPPITIPVEYDPPASEFVSTQFAFALELFKESLNQQEGNDSLLISPLSVALALAMTANGAEGETLAELEELLGLPISELNEEFQNYAESLTSRDRAKLYIANSIWLKENEITLRKEFTDLTAQYYKADVHARPFDQATADEINAWVDQNTDGMIKKLFDELDPEAVLYLINALVFDAKWASQYQDNNVESDEFLTIDGILKKVDMLNSEEYGYLNDGLAQGFVKYYEGNYCFVAMLPTEDVSLEQYVAQLDAQKLYAMINNPLRVSVGVSIPKFKYEYSANFANTLQAMGLSRCFLGQRADFSGIGSCSSGDLAISRVLHKTVIELTEAGTRAAAVTAVEGIPESIPMPPAYSVTLNRPFVYMIVDSETCLPIFMGTVTDILDEEVLGQKESVELVYEDSIEVSLMYEPEDIRRLFADFLVTQKDQKPYGPTMMRIGSEEELAAFKAVCLSSRLAFSPSLPEGFFDENCLIITHETAGSGMIEYDVREATLLRNQDTSQLTVNIDARCPYMFTEDEKCWFIVTGLPKEAATPDSIYSVQFTDVVLPIEFTPSYSNCLAMPWLENADQLFEQYVINKEDVAGGEAPILKISSHEELDALYKLVCPDGTGKLFDLPDNYFDKNELILTYLIEGSGSIRYEIASCALLEFQRDDGSSEIILSVDRYEPNQQTQDIKAWFIAIGASSAIIDNCSQFTVKYTTFAVDYEDSGDIFE